MRSAASQGTSRFIRFHLISGLLSAGLLYGTVGVGQAQEEGSQAVRGVTLSVDAGWSQLHLPEALLGTILEPKSPTSYSTVRRLDNAEKVFEGYRLGIGLHTAPVWLGNRAAILGIKGFYADYGKQTRSVSCDPSLSVLCTVMPIFDPDLTDYDLANIWGDSTVRFVTAREAKSWGVSLEAVSSGYLSALGVRPKVGLAFQRLSDDLLMQVRIEHPVEPPGTVSYAQKFATNYWGGYVGLVGKRVLSDRLMLNLDLEAGLYWADVRYQGHYSSDQENLRALFGGSPISQSLALHHGEAAVILKGRAELEKAFEAFSLLGFVQGEFYSYAPKVKYNDVDRVGAEVFGSSQDGTSIGGGQAYTVSAGLRLSVPLQ